ncbi:Uncharacterised protein [Halioglobus japonicus]|nr:Uncharacterised protein [Halioglobus japonicus]
MQVTRPTSKAQYRDGHAHAHEGEVCGGWDLRGMLLVEPTAR